MNGWQMLGAAMLAVPTVVGLVALARVLPLRDVAYIVGGSLALTAIVMVGVGLLTGELP